MPKIFKIGKEDAVVLRKKVGIEIDKASTISFSEDSNLVAVSEYNKKIFVGERMDGSIDCFGVTPDERYLLSVSRKAKKQSIAVWNLKEGQKINWIDGLKDALLSPDGEVVAVSRRKQVGRIDLGTSVKFKYHNTITLYSMPYLTRRGKLSGVWLISFSPDGSLHCWLVRT